MSLGNILAGDMFAVIAPACWRFPPTPSKGYIVFKTFKTRLLASLILATLAVNAFAHEIPDSTIKHDAHDGVVRLYGAGGPDTAFAKVANVFTEETGIKVEVTGGPEPT